MAQVLHLFKGDHAAEATAVITSQIEAGDRVIVALLDAPEPPLPTGVETLRVPADTSYERLVEVIFTADHVLTW